MATSADRDEDKTKDEAAEDEESAKGKDEHADVEADEKAAGATKSPAKAAAKGHDDEEDEEEDEDDDEEEAKPAAKPATKAVAKPVAKRPAAKAARGPGAARARASAGQGGGSLGKSVLLFFVIVIGLGAGFAILGREPPVSVDRPKWTTGQTVDVEITLVRSDRQDLACASTEEVGGKHCAFEANAKPWSKGDVNDDKKVLKPYTTTDRVQFTAAGLWTDPALTPDKLPASRFSVKCKYKVEGTLKDVGVRWEQTGQWYSNKDWYAGSVSNCTLSP